MLLVGLAAGLAAATTMDDLVGAALDDRLLVGLIVLQGALLAWRLIALGSSLTDPRLPRLRVRDALPVAILVVLVTVPQVYAGYVTSTALESVDEVFVSGPATAGAWRPTATSSPTAPASLAPGATPSPTPTPAASPTPTPTQPRINVLLIGVDSGVGRNTMLTDTMIVASLDRVAGTVSMLSFPRDLVDVPLPGGRHYSGKLNSLLAYARHHPGAFPGSSGDGHDVLLAALSEMTGLEIDYYAQVNLGGFVTVIDSLGGVEVNVAHAFCDPTYDEYGFTRGFAISAGRHKLTGNQALAYARIRHASGESDLTRQTRQQEVLSGIRDRVVKGGFLRDPVGFLKAMSRTVETNIPRKLVATLVEYARKIDRTDTYRGVVAGNGMLRSAYDARGYVLIGDFDKIRVRADSLFTPPGQLPRKAFLAPKPAASQVLRERCLRVRPRRDAEAEAHPEGHPQANPEADAQADREAHRRADTDTRARAHADARADARAGVDNPVATGPRGERRAGPGRRAASGVPAGERKGDRDVDRGVGSEGQEQRAGPVRHQPGDEPGEDHARQDQRPARDDVRAHVGAPEDEGLGHDRTGPPEGRRPPSLHRPAVGRLLEGRVRHGQDRGRNKRCRRREPQRHFAEERSREGRAHEQRDRDQERTGRCQRGDPPIGRHDEPQGSAAAHAHREDGDRREHQRRLDEAAHDRRREQVVAAARIGDPRIRQHADRQPDRNREDRDPGDRRAGRGPRAAGEGDHAHDEHDREHRQAQGRQERVRGDERDREPGRGADEGPGQAEPAHSVTPVRSRGPGRSPPGPPCPHLHEAPGRTRPPSRGPALPAHRQR